MADECADQVSNPGQSMLQIVVVEDTAVAVLAYDHLLAVFCFGHEWAYTAAVPCKLLWIENQNFEGFAPGR